MNKGSYHGSLCPAHLPHPQPFSILVDSGQEPLLKVTVQYLAFPRSHSALTVPPLHALWSRALEQDVSRPLLL